MTYRYTSSSVQSHTGEVIYRHGRGRLRRVSTVYRDHRRRTRSSWTRSSAVAVNLHTYWNQLPSVHNVQILVVKHLFFSDIDAMHKHGLCCRPVSVCPSVCHVGRSIVSRRLPYTIRCGSLTRLLVCSHTLAKSFTVTVAVVCRRVSVYRNHRRRTRSSWTRSSAVAVNLYTPIRRHSLIVPRSRRL